MLQMQPRTTPNAPHGRKGRPSHPAEFPSWPGLQNWVSSRSLGTVYGPGLKDLSLYSSAAVETCHPTVGTSHHSTSLLEDHGKYLSGRNFTIAGKSVHSSHREFLVSGIYFRVDRTELGGELYHCDSEFLEDHRCHHLIPQILSGLRRTIQVVDVYTQLSVDTSISVSILAYFSITMIPSIIHPDY